MSSPNNHSRRCGVVAVVGRPNVGKSTLINRLVGQKISITGPKPHTTRFPVRGVLTREHYQAIFLDTPGASRLQSSNLHRMMRQSVAAAVDDADVIVLVLAGSRLDDADQDLLGLLKKINVPVIAAVNKVDLVRPKEHLLPLLSELSERSSFSSIVPFSAKTGENLDALITEIFLALPEGEWLFAEDTVTDSSIEFRAAELIRERLLVSLHAEVPYGLAVEIEHLSHTDKGWQMHAVVWVEREQHKPIVIGHGGSNLKKVGQSVRRELMGMLEGPVHLEIWVKVKEAWSSDPQVLKRLGVELS